MQKVNVDVHIWNELRSNDRFGFKPKSVITHKEGMPMAPPLSKVCS